MSTSSLLGQTQLFHSLNGQELKQLAAICRKIRYAPGEIIIEQNTLGKEMYLIVQGSVEVFVQGTNRPRSLVVLGTGQVIGEMALIDQGQRSASVRATNEGATLYLIGCQDFYDLCQANNHIGYMVMLNLATDIAFKLRHHNLTEL